MVKNPEIGLGALLRPDDSILVLIGHQPYQFTNLNSHEPTMIINNVVGLAKTAKVLNVPTILTTVTEERGEICVAIAAIQALGEGYDVFVVSDACGAVTVEAHEMALQL